MSYFLCENKALFYLGVYIFMDKFCKQRDISFDEKDYGYKKDQRKIFKDFLKDKVTGKNVLDFFGKNIKDFKGNIKFIKAYPEDYGYKKELLYIVKRESIASLAYGERIKKSYKLSPYFITGAKIELC